MSDILGGKMENLDKNIKDFLYYAEFGENKSLNTIKSLKKDLSQLSEYLKNIEKIEEASKIKIGRASCRERV